MGAFPEYLHCVSQQRLTVCCVCRKSMEVDPFNGRCRRRRTGCWEEDVGIIADA